MKGEGRMRLRVEFCNNKGYYLPSINKSRDR